MRFFRRLEAGSWPRQTPNKNYKCRIHLNKLSIRTNWIVCLSKFDWFCLSFADKESFCVRLGAFQAATLRLFAKGEAVERNSGHLLLIGWQLNATQKRPTCEVMAQNTFSHVSQSAEPQTHTTNAHTTLSAIFGPTTRASLPTRFLSAKVSRLKQTANHKNPQLVTSQLVLQIFSQPQFHVILSRRSGLLNWPGAGHSTEVSRNDLGSAFREEREK